MLKKVIYGVLTLCMLLSFVCYADGDPNVEGDDGINMGGGSGSSFWSRGDEGVRITIVEEKTSKAVSRSVDFASKKQKVDFFFGFKNKIYYYTTRNMVQGQPGAAYTNTVPPGGLPSIIPSNGQNNIESIKRYFSLAGTLKEVCFDLGFPYDKLISGDFVLLIEPLVYMTYDGFRYAMTATEAAVFDVKTSNDLAGKMGVLTHCNLPRSMYLSKPAINFCTPAKPFPKRNTNAQIVDTLGLGTVHFKPEPEPPLPSTNTTYHTDTEVITSVMITADQDYTPDDMGSVTFSIAGRKYTKQFICPDGEQQLVWVKWRTPAAKQHISIKITSDGRASTGSIEADIIDLEENPPPDPQFADPKPKVNPINPSKNSQTVTHRWSVWDATWEEDEKDKEDGGEWEFDEIDYYATLKTKVMLKPNSRVQTAFNLGFDRYDMKSGYGVDIVFESEVSYWCSDYDFTYPQNASVTFPEFGYKKYNRLLELTDTSPYGRFQTMSFKENKYSYYLARTHFTPLRYPDATKYTVNVESFDAWTPIGELKTITQNDNMTINGNVYDDWYVRPIRE